MTGILPPYSSLQRTKGVKRSSSGGLGQKKSHKSKMFRDGRIVLSPHHWFALKEWMWINLRMIYGVIICHLCGGEIYSYDVFQPDHVFPRGLGGGTRDDRFLKPSHAWCNCLRGSVRL